MKDFTNLRFEDYRRMFRRRKWHFFLTVFLVTGAATLIAYFLPRVYRSETTILVEDQGISEGYVKPTTSDRLEDRLSLISQVLKSRTLLEKLIQDNKLYGYGTVPRFLMEDAVRWMKRDIEVTLRTRNTFTVSYLAPKAWLARDITKQLAEEVIRSQNIARQAQAVVTDQFIDEQLRQAEKDLAFQEEKLKAFKMRNLGTLPEQNAGNLAALNGLHSQLIANESALQRAQDQQMIFEQRLQDLKAFNVLSEEVASKSGRKEGVAGTNSRVALLIQLQTKRAALADLSVKYTDKFPDVVRLKKEVQDLEQQLSQLPSGEAVDLARSAGDGAGAAGDSDASSIRAQLTGFKREIATRQKEHEDIQQQIRVYQGRLNLSPRVEQEWLSLTRDSEALRQNYRNLQDKKFNANVAANLEKSKVNETFKVIDEAYLPELPVKPSRRLITLIGLLIGVGLGLGWVLVVEFLDPTLGDEDIATAELKLPVLVSIPEIVRNGKALAKSAERRPLLKQA